MCVSCRARGAHDQLIRVVLNDQSFVVDHSRTAPGRGAHVHLTPECLDNALKRRMLHRALNATGEVDDSSVRVLIG